MITPEKLKKSKIKQTKKCAYCKRRFRYEKDKEIHHLKPIEHGGKEKISNYKVVHKGKCHKEMDNIALKKYGKYKKRK